MRILSALPQLATLNPRLLPRRIKNRLVLTADAVLIPISLYAALGLRLGTWDPINNSQVEWIFVGFVVLISIGLLGYFRLYRLKLHTFDLHAIGQLAKYSLAISIVAVVVSFLLNQWSPRSISILFGAIFFMLAIGMRLAALALLRRMEPADAAQVPVAIYGAGAAGIQLAAALQRTTEVRPVIFVDDNPALQGLTIAGLRVKGPVALARMVQEKQVERILLAIPSLSLLNKTALVERLRGMNCEIQVIPSSVDLIMGKSIVSDLKPIKPQELLNREQVDLDVPEIAKTYAGRCIMVTGAGGSIGSELCHQLMNCAPACIVLFEQSEHSLYQINRALEPLAKDRDVSIVSKLGSVCDAHTVEATIRELNVEIVLHAAAYKHVPIVESNEAEGIRNNVLGTKVVADAAAATEIERFILISTDKAVRPTNIMGASKRLAELVVQDVQSRNPKTKFSMVRFGNVLDSAGSVVPLFREQILAGGPVTVTHKDITRFFMTLPEAASLVLLAGAFAEGRDLFVLDMGAPVRIHDLAKRMIELSGNTVRDPDNPDGDIEIVITGLRPGEKLYEELLTDSDDLAPTPHVKILRANVNGLSQIEVAAMLKQIRQGVVTNDRAGIRKAVEIYVDGYQLPPDRAVPETG